MKKYIPIALIALLSGAQNAALAMPMHDHVSQADLKATRDEMQKKMSAAKSDEERQQLMSEQQKKMNDTNNGLHSNMNARIGDHGFPHMKERPINAEDMQKRRLHMQDLIK